MLLAGFGVFLPLPAQLVRPHQSVHQPDHAVVQAPVLVVPVVALCGRQAEEIVAAVRRGGVPEDDVREEHQGQEVRAAHDHGEGDGKRILQEVVDRVGVDGGKGDGRRELVVLLVQPGVEARVVQETVDGVEEDLAEEDGVDKVQQDNPGRRQLRIDDEHGVAESEHAEHDEVPADQERMVEKGEENAVRDLPARRLLLVGLDLVLSGELREEQINHEVDRGWEEEAQDLGNGRADHLDQAGRIAKTDIPPRNGGSIKSVPD